MVVYIAGLPPSLKAEISPVQRSLTVRLAVNTADVYTEEYDGAYVVVPKSEAQTLPTEKKKMRDDVRVLGIPYMETTNPAGGLTAAIG